MITHAEALKVARVWARAEKSSAEKARANSILCAHIRAMPKHLQNAEIIALASVAWEAVNNVTNGNGER